MARVRPAELEADADSVERLHRQLGELDPAAAAKMEPDNRATVVRALEVTLGSGRPFSSLRPRRRRLSDRTGSSSSACAGRAPSWPSESRSVCSAMLDAGPPRRGRVAGRPAGFSRTARQALGYKELLDHLAGACSLDAAVDDDHHPHPAVRRPPGAVVPPRPAHTLDRHRTTIRWPTGRCRSLEQLRWRPRTDETPRPGQRLPRRCSTRRRRAIWPTWPGGLCDRRRGIGADGLLRRRERRRLRGPHGAVQRRRLAAEMSGNGIRCFAQALAARRGDLGPSCILTDAGDRLVTLYATDDPDVIDGRRRHGRVSPPSTSPTAGTASESIRCGRSPTSASATRTASSASTTCWWSICSPSAARCPTSTSSWSSPGPSRTPSRCACTSVAPASPRHAAPAPAPAPGPRRRGVSSPTGSKNHRAHGRRRCRGTVRTNPTTGHVTLVGPAVFIGSIRVARDGGCSKGAIVTTPYNEALGATLIERTDTGTDRAGRRHPARATPTTTPRPASTSCRC